MSRSERTSTAGESFAATMAAHDDRLSNCVHCGFCLPACPTYTRLGDEADSPRGRLHLMRAVAEGRLDPASGAFQEHIDRCLGCRACETVCPSGVEYGFLLERAREVAGRARMRPSPAPALLLGAIGRPAILAIWMTASRLLRWTGIPAVAARRMPASSVVRPLRLAMGMLAASERWTGGRSTGAAPHGAGVHGRGGLAETGGEGRERVEGPPDVGSSAEEVRRTRGRVGILTGCVQSHLFRRVNEATRRVLEVNGFEVVEVAGQGCCGALHAHAGRLDDARGMAARNLRAFRAAGVDWIAANAAGCGATMKEYPHLVASDAPTDAEWFAARVRDVTELFFLEGKRPVVGGSVSARVAYDSPCHLLHGQAVEQAPLDMLRSIPGVEVVPVPDGEECCGGAGIYGITHPALGGRIGADKAAAVLSTDPDVLATGNPGCAMQIGATLRIEGSSLRVAHPVEVLDESYRRAGFYETRSPAGGPGL